MKINKNVIKANEITNKASEIRKKFMSSGIEEGMAMDMALEKAKKYFGRTSLDADRDKNPSPANYTIIPRQNEWEVKCNKLPEQTRNFESRNSAIEYAKEQAAKENADIYILNYDETIEQVITHF